MGQVLTTLTHFFVYAPPARDTIHINDLLLKLVVSTDDDDVPAQPVLLSLVISHDVSPTARSDDLVHSIDYAAVYATLVKLLPNTRYASLETLLDRTFDVVFTSHPQVAEASVVATLRDTTPQCTVEATRKRGQSHSYRCTVRALAFSTIVGVNPNERTAKQPVVLGIIVQRPSVQDQFPFFSLSTSVRHTFSASEYLTIEALASAIARHVLEYTKDQDGKVTIELSKPNALPLAASAQVQVTRRRADFSTDVSSPPPRPPPTVLKEIASADGDSHSVALALGSNLGDRFANIETAVRLLEIPTALLTDLPEGAHVSVVDTSFMYETAPMYVIDQPRFVNCACMIETNLSPNNLLRLVKAIEAAVGRVPSQRNGPRAVDLDIITYDDLRMDTRPADARAHLDNLIGELVIPHPRLCEREFVLRPLNDMIPHFVHPARHQTVRTLLNEVVAARNKDDGPMFKVMPFPRYPFDSSKTPAIHDVRVPPTAKHWVVSAPYPSPYPSAPARPRKTHLMAILNVTPDSFSDGAEHATIPDALEHAAASVVAGGADMIDVGGCSTRPGAAEVLTERELWRVVPVIKAVRTHPDERVREALVSVDTFRWEVAEEAVKAGANCINDVYAFTGPGYVTDGCGDDKDAEEAEAEAQTYLTQMKRVARSLGVPVVLMHSRGEAGKHKAYDEPNTDTDGHVDEGQTLIRAVRTELGRKVDAIVRGPGGVRRWLVFVDPGIGFSKPVKGQLGLMRDMGQVTASVPVPASGVVYDKPRDAETNALAGYPILAGPSRKSVWGEVLQQGDVEGGVYKAYDGRKTTGKERVWATAAAVACAVEQGASVVRVHDVPEMRDVVAVASAIWSRW